MDGTVVDMSLLLPPLPLLTTTTIATTTYHHHHHHHLCRLLSRVGGPGFLDKACCRWAVRPAGHCPAAGEGPRCRQRHSAVKLIPNDYVGGLALSYRWQHARFKRNRRHICEWQVGPYNPIVGQFFSWPESEIRLRIAKNETSRNLISTALL